jgi:chromosome transmission fidelity protein 18
LRQVALVLNVSKPKLDNVMGRLQSICMRERLKIDPHTLAALYEMTEGDLRSCLNTLQVG